MALVQQVPRVVLHTLNGDTFEGAAEVELEPWVEGISKALYNKASVSLVKADGAAVVVPIGNVDYVEYIPVPAQPAPASKAVTLRRRQGAPSPEAAVAGFVQDHAGTSTNTEAPDALLMQEI